MAPFRNKSRHTQRAPGEYHGAVRSASVNKVKAISMTKHQDVAKALKVRLFELKRRVAEIDQELHTQLPADSEDQAIDLENQEALEALEKSGIQEIQRIEHALKRISEGTYGKCAHCGADIDPKRLKALPTATRCISCAV